VGSDGWGPMGRAALGGGSMGPIGSRWGLRVRALGGGEAVRSEDVHQVLELAVEVADDCERSAGCDRVLDDVWSRAQQLGLAREQLLRDAPPGRMRASESTLSTWST